jgi:hypothetical protein
MRPVLRLHNEKQLQLQEGLETAVRRVRVLCEMAFSLGASQWSGVEFN